MDPATIMAILNAAGGITEGGASAVKNDTYGKGNFIKGASTGIPILGPMFEMMYQKSLEEKAQEEITNAEGISNELATQRYLKKGGLVKGPGTEKSDSIKMKLPVGSFVVPAENSEVAMVIGKSILGWKDGQTLKTGGLTKGQKVHVSDNEVIFTPNEAKTLLARNIDINKLAPNSENTLSLKDGGIMIKPENRGKFTEWAKLHGMSVEEATSKVLKNKEEYSPGVIKMANFSRNFGGNAEGGFIDYKCGGAIRKLKYQEGGEVGEPIDIETSLGYKYNPETKRLINPISKYELDKEGNIYNKNGELISKDDTKHNFPSNDRAQLKDMFKDYFTIGENKEEIQSRNISANKDVSRLTDEEVQERKELYGENYFKNTTPSAIDLANRAEAKRKLITEPGTRQLDSPSIRNLTDEEYNILRKQDDPDLFNIDKALGKEEKPIIATTEGTNKMGLATALGVGQTAAGLAGTIATALNKPEDYKPSEELRDAFGKAQARAQYGLTPLEKSELEKDIESNRMASAFNVRNMSGGSAGTSLANELAVSLNANKARLNVEQYDKQLQMQKQLYADRFISPIMAENQFIYQNKMNKYATDVASWAGLAQSGIHNVIGSLQWQDQKKFEDRLSAIENQPITG